MSLLRSPPTLFYIIFINILKSTFRGHLASHCYAHGYVKNGKYFSVKTGSCRHGNPKMHSWLSIKVYLLSCLEKKLLKVLIKLICIMIG